MAIEKHIVRSTSAAGVSGTRVGSEMLAGLVGLCLVATPLAHADDFAAQREQVLALGNLSRLRRGLFNLSA
jgi:hypothetical protein